MNVAELKKLVINAALAGLWAGLAALQVSGELNKAAIFAAGAVALRAAIGYLADKVGHTVPVDA
jgi:hypothetical protein